jgi:uncharacterized protein YjbK
MEEIMNKLTETLIRDLNENKEKVLKTLETNGSLEYAIELTEEEGEVLITLLMKQAEIEESVSQAVSKVFSRKSSNVVKFGNLIGFVIN